MQSFDKYFKIRLVQISMDDVKIISAAIETLSNVEKRPVFTNKTFYDQQ